MFVFCFLKINFVFFHFLLRISPLTIWIWFSVFDPFLFVVWAGCGWIRESLGWRGQKSGLASGCPGSSSGLTLLSWGIWGSSLPLPGLACSRAQRSAQFQRTADPTSFPSVFHHEMGGTWFWLSSFHFVPVCPHPTHTCCPAAVSGGRHARAAVPTLGCCPAGAADSHLPTLCRQGRLS